MSTTTAPSPALIATPGLYHLESADPLAIELAAYFLAEESARGASVAARYLESGPCEYDTWLGGALIGLRHKDGSPAAGGAYRRYDATTAELAQLWTTPELRRKGLASQVLRRLELIGARSGYERMYAVAEPRQNAVRHLLFDAGYTALGGRRLEYLGFVKALRTA